MNLYTNAHFSSVPTMHHQRSRFDRSCSHKLSWQCGQIVPILAEEVLPGDTVQLTTSNVVRLQTMLTPVMDSIYLDKYYFFCPNRILWKHWVDFVGENTQSAWIPSVEYTVPCVASPAGGFQTGTLADYLGWPLGVEWSATDPGAPSALPLRAIAMIYNDFFRDQNVTDPLLTDDSDNNITGSNGSGLEDVIKGGQPPIAAKFHDYYTSCLPSPQKGPQVNILGDLGGPMPVYPGPTHNMRTLSGPNGTLPIPPAFFAQTSSTGDGEFAWSGALYNNELGSIGFSGNDPSFHGVYNSPDGKKYDYVMSTVAGNYNKTQGLVGNLWAHPQQNAFNVSVDALRLATLTQQYYESLARSGSRYEEILQQFFGVRNPDARINHPEYLGGNRVALNVRQVTNTAQSEQDFLGDLGAQSATTDTHHDFVKSFTEHGWLIGFAVVRYDHSYSQGMPLKYTRKNKFDYYNPLFAQIGEQPVYDRQIYATSESLANDTVFGYQEAWATYRYGENRASGYLRPEVANALGHWTLGDYYLSKPTLSDGWIREDRTNLDRALAVTSTLTHQIFGDFYFDMKWTRPMPMYSVPGALGHF